MSDRVESDQAGAVGHTRSLDDHADSLRTGLALLLVLAVVQRLVGFGRNVLVCRLLQPEQLGYWSLANSFLMLAAPLVVLGIPGSFARYLAHYRQRGNLRLFLRRTLLACLMLTVLGVALLLRWPTEAAWLAFGETAAVDLLQLVAVALVAVVLFNTCTELLTAFRCVRAVCLLQFANSILFTILAIVLIKTWQQDAESLIAGYAAACGATAIAAVLMVTGVVRSAPPDHDFDGSMAFWRKLLPFAVWFWLSDLLMNLFASVDRYMIIHWPTWTDGDRMTTVGQYHSSRIVGLLFVAVIGMFGTTLLSYLSHDWEAGRRDRACQTLDRAVKWIAVMLTVAGVCVLLLAPWVFQWALASKYDEGLRVLPVTMSYCIWFGLLAVATNYLWCCEKAWLTSLPVVLGLLLNVLLNAWWLPHWGLAGAVAATAVSNVLALLLVMVLSCSLGMRYRSSTWFCVLLPGLLACGAAWTLSALALIVAVAVKTGWLLTGEEKREIWQAGTRVTARVASACRWPASFGA